MSGNIMIVDDELFMSDMLATLLGKHGYETLVVSSAQNAREKVSGFCPDLVLIDLMLPDGHGADLMVELASIHPSSKFIIITGHGSVRSAVETTQMGAEDYLEKPFEPERLLLSVRNAMMGRKLREELNLYRHRTDKYHISVSSHAPSPHRTPAMTIVYDLAKMAAESSGSVLILGETGVGKDYLAKWIHSNSPRCEEPYFSVNCSAISKELAESELFGHEPGAFTGAKGRKLGMLELAQKGTLLLNEIGELDLATQAKLLTFLDTKSFLRIGGQR
ncbi:sigma 54-interacting transcriptional regulator, partial [Myxococcota bacterium]|nr:sigma 54-interacting transcriptional regulator [Myxococcota bacterium]